jgi:hypothetical protein
MDRSKLNFLVDSLMFISIGAVGLIGVLMGFIIPRGEAAPSAQKYLWELHRHDWGNIHLYLSLVFLGFLAVHIFLHWSWIKGMIGKYFGKASIVWVYVLAPFVLLFFLWLFYPKSSGPNEQHFGSVRSQVQKQRTGGSGERGLQRRSQRQ